MTTTFDETVHPRAATGEFTKKYQSTPELSIVGPDEIVGYTFRAENLSPAQILEIMNARRQRDMEASGSGEHFVPFDDVEQLLDQEAIDEGLDREDEHSWDSDDFPKVILESQVTINDHAFLGRPYFTFPDGDGDDYDASTALDVWAERLDLPVETTDALWDGTDYQNQSVEEVLNTIAANAEKLGVDFDVLGTPMPVQHNATPSE